MITVADALDRLFALAGPLPQEEVPLRQAAGRVLAHAVVAARHQPPFDASAMDGYAVRSGDAMAGTRLAVIGEAAAGRRFTGAVGPGEAVRIFTGAPMPAGADAVVIQEDADRQDGHITLREGARPGENVRPAGGDFRASDRIEPPRRLSPADLALAAAMNAPTVRVTRRPVVAILSTGDELVMPGEVPGEDQIVASNVFGLAALFEDAGAQARILPVARDTVASLKVGLELAQGADLIVTVGGASVGDHDIVALAAESLGLERTFYKVAMRPGKPLMAGRIGGAALVGLPGNPVSAMVCGVIFVVPMIRSMLGLGTAAAGRRIATLACDIEPNGPREHYMRAIVAPDGIRPFDRQDSSLLSILGRANALLVRPVHDPARPKGDSVEYIPL